MNTRFRIGSPHIVLSLILQSLPASAAVVGWWGFEETTATNGTVITSSTNSSGAAGPAMAGTGTAYYSSTIPGPEIFDPISNTFRINRLSSIAYNSPSRFSQNLEVSGTALNTSDFTMEFFLRQNLAGEQFQTFAGRLNTSGWGLQHGNDSDANKLRARFRTSVSPNYFLFTNSFLGDNQWHHVALSYHQTKADDPATTSVDEGRGVAKIYVDYQQQSDSLTVLGTVTTAENLKFLKPGSFSGTSGFSIAMDEIRYHNAALDGRSFLSRPLGFPNGNFEQGLTDWNTSSANGMFQIVSSPVHSGTSAIQVHDTSPTTGGNIRSAMIPVSGPDVYELRGWVRIESGSGIAVDVFAYNQSFQQVLPLPSTYTASGPANQWIPFSQKVFITSDTSYLQVRVISYTGGQGKMWFDDLKLVSLNWPRKTPWAGAYKIKSTETSRLTAADIVGPDGYAYPNWTQTGVQGGIPSPPLFVVFDTVGGIVDDGNDDSEALQAVCDAAGDVGGGVILLSSGTYNLRRPVVIRNNGTVIRGQGHGPSGTTIDFDYTIPETPGVEFLTPLAGATIGPDSMIQLQTNPSLGSGSGFRDLKAMRILVKNKIPSNSQPITVKSYTKPSVDGGNVHALDIWGSDVMSALAISGTPRVVTLTCQSQYAGDAANTWKQSSIDVTVDPTMADAREKFGTWFDLGAIRFAGKGRATDTRLLTQNGKRGDTVLHVANTTGLAVGKYIYLEAPATADWKKLTDNAVTAPFLDGYFRVNVYKITAISGSTVTIGQPLRIDFPVDDGSYIQSFQPVTSCGIEDLDITHSSDLWFSSVYFQSAVNCWMSNVNVTMTGKHPYYSKLAKWCEVKDCVFDRSHFNGGGGSAYVGWELSFDNLVTGVEASGLRHGPNFQWGASGNVVKDCVFNNTDGQAHAGWAHENLVENTVIRSDKEFAQDGIGGSGHGFYSTFPNDASHGPNGPRNVLYNNLILAKKRGILNGGMNEGWLVFYNYIRAGNGVGMEFNWGAFDHVVKGNIFVLQSASWPTIQTNYPDCLGLEFINNTAYCDSGMFYKGVVPPAINTGNTVHPKNQAPTENFGHTSPAVPSIYDWQQ